MSAGQDLWPAFEAEYRASRDEYSAEPLRSASLTNVEPPFRFTVEESAVQLPLALDYALEAYRDAVEALDRNLVDEVLCRIALDQPVESIARWPPVFDGARIVLRAQVLP